MLSLNKTLISIIFAAELVDHLIYKKEYTDKDKK